MNEYNYRYHRISVAIFEWAESQVRHTDTPREYYDNELQEAYNELAKGEFNSWLPVYEPYKGKAEKKRGWIYVAVRMPNGQDYGFLYYKSMADQIYPILHNLWCDFIGNQEAKMR